MLPNRAWHKLSDIVFLTREKVLLRFYQAVVKFKQKSHNLAWNLLTVKADVQKHTCFCKQFFPTRLCGSCSSTLWDGTNRHLFSVPGVHYYWPMVRCCCLFLFCFGMLLFSESLLLNSMFLMVQLKMDRFKVISEVFNQKLSYSRCPIRVKETDATVSENVSENELLSLNRSVVMVKQWWEENRTWESKGASLFITEMHQAKIFSWSFQSMKNNFCLVSKDFQIVIVQSKWC